MAEKRRHSELRLREERWDEQGVLTPGTRPATDPAQVSLSTCSVTFCQVLWWPRGESVPLQAS